MPGSFVIVENCHLQREMSLTVEIVIDALIFKSECGARQPGRRSSPVVEQYQKA